MTEQPDLLPAWAYDLIIAAERHEAVHGNHYEGWACLQPQLSAVPAHHRTAARAVANYLDGKAQTGASLQDLVAADAYTGMGSDRQGQMPCWFYDLLDAMDVRRKAVGSDFDDILDETVPTEELNASRAIGNYLRERMAGVS